MTFYQRMRLAHGLRWSGKYPNMVKEALVIVGCICAYGLVAHIDDLGDREAQMASHWSWQFSECLNGRWRGITESGEQIACLPAETFNPKRGS